MPERFTCQNNNTDGAPGQHLYTSPQGSIPAPVLHSELGVPILRETVIRRSPSPRRRTVADFNHMEDQRPPDFSRRTSHPPHMTFQEIPTLVITLPDEEPTSVPVSIPQRPHESFLSGNYRVPGGMMTYSSPGTPDSSVGSPVSPEGVILDSNSNDQDHLEIFDQNLDNQDLQALMVELEQTAIQESTSTIQADGFHQDQHQDQLGDLLSTLLTNNEILVTENEQVYHQMQNMQ